MDDKKNETAVCFNCSNTSDDAPLFRVLVKNVKKWACARCLPFLIHGPH